MWRFNHGFACDFLKKKSGQNLRCVLYTGTHYTWVNTVMSGPSGNQLVLFSLIDFVSGNISIMGKTEPIKCIQKPIRGWNV